jgi:predicted nucleotide-binding protein
LQTLDTKEKNSTRPITDSGKRGRKAGAIYFPRHSLKEVLPVAEAIWTQNAGNPFDILDVAKAIGQSPTSGRFVVRLASSYRYGLTEGSASTKVISLTPLGSSIVAPTADTDINSQQRKALLFSPIFQTVYGWMDRKPIPREEVFRNTLMKPADLGGFGIPREDVDEFVRVFMQNIEDYGLSDDTAQGVKYLRLDKLSPAIASEELPTAEGLRQQPQLQTELAISSKTPPPPLPGFQPQIPKQIFVAHGKNRKPLDQLERILTRFKVPYKVAQEEPNSGRPVSLKVAELMKQCTSGIFIFTADEETADQQGEKILRPSDNVVYELGAASVLYGNKIVIFKEEGVKFASDFGDIGYISFDKDRLDAKAADLMLELITLGFVQLTPT